MCLQLEVQVMTTDFLIRQVWLKLKVQVVDNKPLNKASVFMTRGSTSGQQIP